MLKLRLVIRRVLLVLAACVWISSVVGAVHATGGRQQPQAAPPRDASSLRPVVDRYCVSCHSARVKTAGIVLEGMDAAGVEQNSAVLGEGRAQAPDRRDAPAAAAATGAGGVRRADRLARDDARSRGARRAESGPTAVHRLNRAEYANAIRDLLALDVDPAHAAAARRFELRLRQHRRRAGRVAGAARALSRRRPARSARWRSAIPTTAPARRDLSRAPGLSQDRAPRRPAARHASAACSSATRSRSTASTVQGQAAPDQPRSDARPRVPAPARDHRRRRAGASGADRRRRRRRRRARERDATARRDRRAAPVRVPVKAGPRAVGAAFVEKSAGVSTRHGCSRFCAARRDTLDCTGLPHIEQFTITGPVQRDRARRHAEPAAHLHVPPSGDRATEGRVRAADPVDAGAARVSAARDRRRTSRALIDFYEAGRREGHLRRRHRARAASACWRARSSCSASRRTRPVPSPGDAYRISDLELASRLSFFLWSSIPDDELLDAGGAGPAEEAGGARAAGAPHARRPDARDALVSNFAGQWLYLRNLRNVQPELERVPRLRRQPAAGVPARDRAVLRQHHARGPQRARPADRRLHVRQRAAGASTTASRTSTAASSAACTLTDDARRGLLGQGQHPAVTSHADRTSPVRARQVDSREPARHAAAAAAAQRAGAQGKRRTDGKPRSRCASGWRSTARTRSARRCHKVMDPLGLRARELRRGRRVADAQDAAARRSTRRASSPTARRSTAS